MMLDEEGPHSVLCKFCCFVLVKHVLFFDLEQLALLVAALYLAGFACLTEEVLDKIYSLPSANMLMFAR